MSAPVPADLDLSEVITGLEHGREHGWHLGAQVYVSLHGEVLLDTAVGEAAPGRALRVDDVMLWYSAGKPWTTVAVLRLWEQGLLGLDDLVADYVDGWGNGKERATVRHVLTHTGGFPIPGDPAFDADITFDESVALVAESPALWEPGTKAGYHPASGWRILGAIVERVDGRRIDRYLREEVAAPLGLDDSWLGIPLDRQAEYGDRARARPLDGSPAAEARGGRGPDGPVPDRRGAQRAVAHREGRARRRHARPGA